MVRLRALLTAAALAAGIVLASTSAGFGADATIAHVETTDAGLQILVSIPPDTDLDLEGVAVSIDGQVAPAEAALAASIPGLRRTAVLAIDTSNSMRGDRFNSAKQAARTFIKSVPDDVYVGIVTFAGEVDQPLPPTLDRRAARRVVAGLTLSPRTRLYDGVLAGVEMAGTEGQRTLLVLSDGADTTDTSLETTTSAITDSDVLVDVVALEQSGTAVEALTQLADAGGGRVISADIDALRATFADEADILARQILVTTAVPSEVSASQATVQVILPTGSGRLTAQAFVTVRDPSSAPDEPGSASASPDRGWSPPPWVMYAGVGAFGIGLIAVLMLLVPNGSAPISIADRVSHYTSANASRGSTGPRVGTEQALTQAKDAAAGLLQRNQGLEVRISKRLESAGSQLKSSEWLLLQGAIFIGSGLIGLLIGKGSLIVGLVFMAFGILGPWIFLGFRGSRRRKAFNSQLPETLQLMSGSLAAGLSLAQSVDTIVKEGAEPITSEFKRVLAETRLGVSLEDAFEGVADRFASKDFEWVVMAIRIQRQVGGNLAELLETVAATMREREYMRRQVAALAAEGKLSAWVLGLLPPLFMVYLLLTNRDYVSVMFTEPLGLLMLAGAGLILSIGVFWMSRLIKVEI